MGRSRPTPFPPSSIQSIRPLTFIREPSKRVPLVKFVRVAFTSIMSVIPTQPPVKRCQPHGDIGRLYRREYAPGMAPHHKRVRPKIGPIDFEAAKKRGGVREPGGERRAEERNGGEGEDGEGVADQVSPTTSSGSLVALITPTSGLERWTDRAKVKSTASSPQSDTSSRLSEDKRAIELAAPRSARIQRAGIALNEATGQARSTFFVAEPSTSQQSGDVVQEGEENRAVDKFVATLQTLTIRSTRRTEQGVVSIAPTPDSIQASKDIFLAKRRSLIRDIQDLMAVGDYHRSVMDSLNDTTSCSEPLSAWEEQAKARTRVILRKNSRQLFHARWALQHIGDVLENIDNGPRG